MKSKKPSINFNDFWPLLIAEKRRQGLGKGEWLLKSGIAYQRYSEFESGDRDISTKYFLRLTGGLNMKIEDVERRLGRKFSEDQKRLMKFDAKVEANREWIEVMLNDPELLKMCKTISLSKKE